MDGKRVGRGVHDLGMWIGISLCFLYSGAAQKRLFHARHSWFVLPGVRAGRRKGTSSLLGCEDLQFLIFLSRLASLLTSWCGVSIVDGYLVKMDGMERQLGKYGQTFGDLEVVPVLLDGSISFPFLPARRQRGGVQALVLHIAVILFIFGHW